jgi:parvulin-like peptidyl-prolyl isomerase
LEFVDKVREAKLGALKALVERELIISDFESKKFILPETAIEERVRKVVDENYEGDRQALVRTLQANGITFATFKENKRREIIVQAMRARYVSSAVVVSPYQIEQYYQENIREFVRPDEAKVRMIYMKRGLFKEKRTSPDGKEMEVDPQSQIMNDLLQKVETGSDFANLARSYSEGPQRLNGGDLGWVSEKTLRKELSKDVFGMRPGQNSKVIETDDGYYLLLVEDMRKSNVIPLAEVRDRIESTLLQRERERLQQEWLDSLRSRAFIKMFF